jgi:hypothetical protein
MPSNWPKQRQHMPDLAEEAAGVLLSSYTMDTILAHFYLTADRQTVLHCVSRIQLISFSVRSPTPSQIHALRSEQQAGHARQLVRNALALRLEQDHQRGVSPRAPPCASARPSRRTTTSTRSRFRWAILSTLKKRGRCRRMALPM